MSAMQLGYPHRHRHHHCHFLCPCYREMACDELYWCLIFYGRLGIGRNSLWTSLNDLLNSTFGPLASRHLECNLNGVLNVCVTNVVTNFCYFSLVGGKGEGNTET